MSESNIKLNINININPTNHLYLFTLTTYKIRQFIDMIVIVSSILYICMFNINLMRK